MRRSAFTLVELLLVIAIIAVLAGLLIPIIGMARKVAKEAKCQTQLATINTAIVRYKDINGTIPETDPNPPITGDRYVSAFKIARDEYRTVDSIPSSAWEAVAQALIERLQTVERDNFRDPSALRDPFTGGGVATNVIRYRPAKYYPDVQHPSIRQAERFSPPRKVVDGYVKEIVNGKEVVEPPPNLDSYQLWSTGFDGKDQFGERVDGRKSDDITNWKTN